MVRAMNPAPAAAGHCRCLERSEKMPTKDDRFTEVAGQEGEFLSGVAYPFGGCQWSPEKLNELLEQGKRIEEKLDALLLRVTFPQEVAELFPDNLEVKILKAPGPLRSE